MGLDERSALVPPFEPTMQPSDKPHHVVVNHEQQYSIWASAEPPAGWQVVGQPGTRDECLDRIATLWTDMRPLSLREFMSAELQPIEDSLPEPDLEPTLVDRLCCEQDIELELFAAPSLELLRERLEQGVLHLRFPATRGPTILAIELDPDTRAKAATLDADTPALELYGALQLDFVDLHCRARIALGDLRGRGSLIRR